MLSWLKWLIAPREMAELDRWRIECGQAERWLAESEDARHALEYVRGMAEGVKCENIAWVRDRMRQQRVNIEVKINNPDRRKNRDAPERKLFDEIKEGMADPERERNGGVDYRFINLTGEER